MPKSEFQRGNVCELEHDSFLQHRRRPCHRACQTHDEGKADLGGITVKPAALARFFLLAPVMSRLSEEVHNMARLFSHRGKKSHELCPVINMQMSQVGKLLRVMEECNLFQKDTHHASSYARENQAGHSEE